MNIAWIDLETTGLDPRKDRILEIAVVVTDPELNELAYYQAVTHWQSSVVRALCCPYVYAMHTRNGLFEALDMGIWQPFDVIEAEVIQLLAEHDAIGGPMAGSTVSFDRAFLKEWCPRLVECWSHRHLDVSAFKEWLKLQGTEYAAPQGPAEHRALADVRASITQLRWLRGLSL